MNSGDENGEHEERTARERMEEMAREESENLDGG